MTAWIEQAPSLLVALAVLVVPGLPVALCMRAVSGIVRLGVAVGVSLGVVAAASLIAPVLGQRWGLIPVASVSALVWLVAATLRFFDRGGPEVAPARSRGVWISVGGAFIGWVVILLVGIGQPDHPSQLYDGLFHLNAVEFIAATGDASPLHMTMATPSLQASFYPTLWHALVSLVVPISGSVVLATNMTTLAVVALVWPVALAALTSVALPGRPRAALWAPLLGFGISVFPLGFLNWGVLYPNLLGTVLIPMILATVLLIFAPAPGWAHKTLRVLVALAIMGATTFAHPSALLGAVALVVPYLLWRAWRFAVSGPRRRRVVVAIAVAIGLAGLMVIWVQANVTTDEWLPSRTISQALGEVAFLNPVNRSTGLLLGPLAALGIWQIVRQRIWWILWSYAVSIGLYLVASWLPVLWLRSAIVGVWYDDTTRVAALLAMWGIPLASIGATVVWDWLLAIWATRRRAVALATAAIIVLAGATHLLALRNDLGYMRGVSFRFDEGSQGLSPDEAALFARAAEELPEDSLVIGDPLTGAGLLFAYTGENVVFPHVTGRYGRDAAVLARYFVDGGPAVCDAAERLGVTHAVDFGDTVLYENHYTTYDGLHGLDDSPILTEVDRVGEAALYEITGCQ